MADEWTTVRVEDIAEKIAMGPFGSNIKVETFVATGVPVISGAHLRNVRLEDGAFNFVTAVHAERMKNSNVFRGDVIFTHAGNIGQVAYIPPNSQYERYVISQRQFYLRCDLRKADPAFVSYFFHSPEGQHKLLANASQTGVPSIARPSSYLKTIELSLPSLFEQRAIAYILGTLDDKIELNRRRNQTLEAMARALFKDWFVDFGPVRAKMEGRRPDLPADLWQHFPDRLNDEGKPEGWAKRPLDEIADFLNGLALQKFPATDLDGSLPVIKIAELRNGISAKSDRASREVPAKYIINDGDFLFSWSGSLLARFWTEGEGALNQHLFKVSSEGYPMWFVSHWVHHHLEDFRAIAASKATTMGHIQRGHLKAAMTLCPPDDVLERLGVVIAPLVEQGIHNELESRTLAQLRDTLLPRLISGELRVADAKKFLEMVRL